MSQATSPPPQPSKGRYLSIIIFGGLGMLLLGTLFWYSMQKRHRLAKEAADASKPRVPQVVVTKPVLSADTAVLLLPGDIQGYRETLLYARVNGYVQNWYVDIGDFVKEGQLLAKIETPELNQQLVQAQANLELAKASLDRVLNIPIEGAVSKQQKDEREGAYRAALAMVNQLKAQTSFKNVIAPFSGFITTRNVDIGTLVTAGGTGSKELFKLDQVFKLRIFVSIPQTFVPSIYEGMKATVLVQEYPNGKFIGKIRRTAGALDMASRTMLAQVELDNPQKKLLPGMYAQVKLTLKRTNRPYVIPAGTLALRTQGPQVLTVTPQHTIKIKNVKISRDNGATLEISEGLDGTEQLVINPSLGLTEGLKVQIVKH
jgi:RND family efflux transporter MFP subunit